MAISVSNNNTAPLADNKSARTEPKAAENNAGGQETGEAQASSASSYADTAKLSLAAKLLSLRSAERAAGSVNSTAEAQHLAANLRVMIALNGEQAIDAQAKNATPELLRLLGSE